MKSISGMVVSLFLLLCSAGEILACPACKDSYVKGSQNASAGASYSWSVLFMLAVPLLIVTIFTCIVVRKARQTKPAL